MAQQVGEISSNGNANIRRMLRRVCLATIPTAARAEMGEFVDMGISSAGDLMDIAISKPVTPYDLRHTAATLLLADGRGMSLIQCADYLDHSPQMLEQIYRHAQEVRGTNFDPFSGAERIAERVDAALSGDVGKPGPGVAGGSQL